MDLKAYMGSFTLASDEFGGCRVATTYVGQPPVMFRTLVTGGRLDGRVWSHVTYEEALIQHNRVVDMAKTARGFV